MQRKARKFNSGPHVGRRIPFQCVAGVSEPLARDEWGGGFAFMERHSLHPGNGAKSLWQGQTLYVFVYNQHMWAASSVAHGPASG